MPNPSTFLRELRATLALAVPIVVGHLGQMLINTTDNVMIGRLGAVPLAAAAFAGLAFGLAYVTAIGLLTAISVRAAFAHGAGRPRDAGEALRHGLLVTLGASLALAGGIQLLSNHLGLFGQPPEVAAAARPFLSILGWSLVPALLFLAIKNYYEALGRPWTPLFWVLGGVILNAFLNWVLLYGNLGIPALGLVGSGWASLLSRSALVLGLVLHLLFSPGLASAHPPRWLARPSLRELHDHLRLGLPVAAQLVFEVGLFAVAGILMGWLGTVALAAHQVAINCAGATFMVPLGISIALSVRIGHARGAGNHHLLREIGLGGIGAGVAFMAVTATVFMTLGRPIASLFIADPAVIAVAAQLLVVASVFQLFDGLQVTSIGALRGLTDVRGPTLITFCGYWLLALPAAWIAGFPLGRGPVGIWVGLAIGLAVCAAALLWRFFWRTRDARPAPACPATPARV